MATKLAYLGVAVLAIIAVILGYKIYQQQTAINNQTASTTQQPNDNTNPAINKNVPQLTKSESSQSSDTTPTAEDLYLFMSKADTLEYKDKYIETAKRLAVETNVINYSNCKAKPVSVKMKKDSEVQLKNNDAYPIEILHEKFKIFKVPANQSITIKTDFGSGIYGYGCTGGLDIRVLSGVLYVTD